MMISVASTVFSILFSSIFVNLCNGNPWTQSSTPQIPGGGSQCAAGGFYDDKAWMIGGVGHEKSVISYDFNSNQYNTHPDISGAQIVQMWGSSEYAQYENTLYWITPSPISISRTTRYISTYDMSSKSYTQNAVSYVPPSAPNTVYTDQAPCLVFYGNLLFILGGFSEHTRGTVDYFSIYDRGANNWKNMGPPLPQKLVHMTCEIVGDMLFLIGGVYLQSSDPYVEILSTSIYSLDVKANSLYTAPHWLTFPSSLSQPRQQHSSVVVGSDIYVVGGITTAWKIGVTHIRTKTVEIIHTATQQISTYNSLIQEASRANLFFFKGILYLFGGHTQTVLSDKYQKSDIRPPTPQPTSQTITCNAANSCKGKTLSCSKPQTCFISCGASNACQDATINGPISAAVSISCNGIEACIGAKISAESSTDLTITSTASSALKNAVITCPTSENTNQYGRCSLTCSATKSCAGMFIYGATFAEMVSAPNWDTPLTITCSGEESCLNANVDSGFYASKTTIQSCHSNDGCRGISILCLNRGKPCIISGATTGTPLHGITITSPNGWNGVTISGATGGGTMRCWNPYHECTISTSSWSCTDGKCIRSNAMVANNDNFDIYAYDMNNKYITNNNKGMYRQVPVSWIVIYILILLVSMVCFCYLLSEAVRITKKI